MPNLVFVTYEKGPRIFKSAGERLLESGLLWPDVIDDVDVCIGYPRDVAIPTLAHIGMGSSSAKNLARVVDISFHPTQRKALVSHASLA